MAAEVKSCNMNKKQQKFVIYFFAVYPKKS